MSADFNAVHSTRNAFCDSGYDARGRNVPFTIRFWFATGRPRPGKTIVVLSGANWSVNLLLGSGLVAFGVGSVSVSPPAQFGNGGWHYFLCGFDGERIFCQLDDGVRQFATPPAPALFGPGLTLSLGEQGFGVTTYAGQKLDEVAIWKNRVLSEAEAAEDMDTGSSFAAVSNQDLLAYWEMEGAVGAEPTALVDSLNGYALNRGFTTNHPSPPQPSYYTPGISGTALLGANEESIEVLGFNIYTYFATADEAFTFGDA